MMLLVVPASTWATARPDLVTSIGRPTIVCSPVIVAPSAGIGSVHWCGAEACRRTVNGDVELVGRRQDRSVPDRELARWEIGEDMDGEGAVDALEHALIDHVARAVESFSPRLEHEADPAGQRVPVFGEESSRADQHRHVGIVATGVHASIVSGLEVDRIVLLEWKSIHVAAQEHGGAGLAGVEIGHHRGERPAEGDVESESGERIGDLALGLGEVEAQLGIGMDRPSKLDGLRVEVSGRSRDVGSDVGEAHSSRLPLNVGAPSAAAESRRGRLLT